MGEIEFCVYFGSTHGISPDSVDAGFGRRFAWDIPLLEGYPYRFPNGLKYKNYYRKKWLLDIIDARKILAGDGITQVLLMVSWNTILFRRILSICQKTRRPLIYRGETVAAHWRQSTYWGKTLGWIKNRVKKTCYPRFLKKIDLFLTTGTLSEQFLLEHGVAFDRLIRAPYCVDNEYFFRGVDRRKKSRELHCLREEINLPPEAKVVLYTGKLIPRKRPVDLIKAVKRLPRDLNAVLVVVGDGILMKKIRKEAEGDKRIHLVGFQNQKSIIKYYAMGDVFVLPSAHETWGLSVNEAMASGLPVIVSDGCTCARDLVVPGKTGYIYPLGNVDELTERLERLLSDEELRIKMAFNAREKVKHFSVETTTRAITKAFFRSANLGNG